MKNTKDFFEKKTENLDLEKCWDVHAHLLGVGDGQSGISIKVPNGWLSKKINSVRIGVFKKITKSEAYPTDESYVNHYARTAQDCFNGFKSFAFAFTSYHSDGGIPQEQLSDFIIPNEWSYQAAQNHSSLCYVASIHPYSPTALEQLERAKAMGAKAIKWLPCAQNINPSLVRCDDFYQKLVELNLPLISHAGAEHAVKGPQFDQRLGNPLLLRRPLEAGVRVVIAHCSTDGIDVDFDSKSLNKVKSFELFSRLMNDTSFEKNLFADISATPQINRAHYLPKILENEHWHSRLLNGSDYPLPALPFLFNLPWLRYLGLLSSEDAKWLKQVKKENVLRFDFLLKKCLTYKGISFPKNVFETADFFN